MRDPVEQIEHIGTSSGGQIAEFSLGVLKHYVVTNPDHIQQVLREESVNFPREGMFWSQLTRLFGHDSVLSEGEGWKDSRNILQPMFTARSIKSITQDMADFVNDATVGLPTGVPLEINPTMSSIVNRLVVAVFFGNKISTEDCDELTAAFAEIVVCLAVRTLLPFIPDAVRLPGDKAFQSGVAKIDRIMYKLTEQYRNDPGEGTDIFTALCLARTPEGEPYSPEWIRDNLIAMFGAGVETTNNALTWVWMLLELHPEAMERLIEEAERVVGDSIVTPDHLPELVYTKQVIQECLRLNPPGWLLPRRAVQATTIGGVEIKAGQNILISPRLTHRLESVWPDALKFDPERWAPDAPRPHKYAYFPFGAGPHVCLGQHVFLIEAEMIVARILSLYRVKVHLHDEPLKPVLGPSLRPRHEVKFTLTPAVRD